MVRNATISDVARSVVSCDGAATLDKEQIQQIVDFTLRKVIGFNCLNDSTLHIDLDNGHCLVCSVKRPIGPTDV